MKKEEAIELLPEYINGALSEEKRAEIEHLIQVDEELKLELDFLSNMREAIKDEAIVSPTEWGLARLKKSIEEESETETVAFSPWWKKAAIAASCAFLIQSGYLFQQQYNLDDSFRPLSTSSVENTIQVQFKKGVEEEQVRQLLISLQGNIVAGPSAVGIYSIQFEDKDTALTALNNSQLIEYAEQENE